jgi:LuxR family maltose regulon positive regulatory protein
MAMPVLATKLFVPLPRPKSVARPRLTTKLAEGLRAGRKVTLVTAPAGFGKTTLLSEWIAAALNQEPNLRVAWLSLEAGDNDPARFLTYLSAALSRADPEVGSVDLSPQQPIDEALAALINEVAQSGHKILLVLDDFQSIDDTSIRDSIVFLIDHLPETLHLAIASRSDPLLPAARLRARGELTELRASDLRFSPDEASAFLNSVMGLTLSSGDVAALETRTEGWIAGLQLAALSLQERTDVSGFISAFTGSNRFVIDYLIEEVLEGAPADVREFLVETAILERLSGPLCDAVTGRANGADMLEYLDRANLFVVPLDDRRAWFRYHHLFADVLKSRLLAEGRDHQDALHASASDWYGRNGSAEDAVHHAFEAYDFDRAARLIEAAIPAVRQSRQDATVLGWLNRLPEETIRDRPVLTVFSAWSSLVVGDIAAVEPRLVHAEFLLTRADENSHSGDDKAVRDELASLPVTIELYRAAVAMATGDHAAIKTHAQLALARAQTSDYLGRGAASGLLGLASGASGDLAAGVEAFAESSANLRRAGNLTDALTTTLVIADMLIPLGRLRDARTAYEHALRESREQPDSAQPAADLHAGFAMVLFESNQVAEARQHLADSEEVGAGNYSHEHRYRWFVAMARACEVDGEWDAALDFLTEAERHYRRGFFPDARPISALKARLRITQGDLTAATSWATELRITEDDDLSYLREFEHVTLARLLIAQSASRPQSGGMDTASELVARLLDAAGAGGRTGSVIEILILQSLALGAQGHIALALKPLQQALELAEPEGYFRLFADEGAPMLRLLRAAAGAGIRPDFVRRLSQALRHKEGAGAEQQPAAEALSERELHVLRLLATPLSGPEISRELHVSLNTMRTHTKHIFAKLGVTSRAAAVRRSEALGLI